jgi:hypothetical protein
MRKEYIGDGCYVAFDGYALVLTTENGISVQNTIVLEPEVWTALKRYVERLKDESDRAARAGDVRIAPGTPLAARASQLIADGMDEREADAQAYNEWVAATAASSHQIRKGETK